MAMTIDEARATIWPFREFKGRTMGYLLDNQLISHNDLLFAIERAYAQYAHVREAARILLRHALEQQAKNVSPAGPLNVFSSERRSYAERRQLGLTLLQGVVFGFVLGILIAFVVISILNRPDRSEARESYNTVVVILGIIGVILLSGAVFFLQYSIFSWIDKRFERAIQRHRKGQLGEERILNVLYSLLDGRWWVFRNLELPGQRMGDIDLVLVGPTGVWALEVKAFDGEYRNVGDRWERRSGSRWLPAFGSPSSQAKKHAAALSHILQRHNVKQWITAVVVWANPDATLTVQNPSVLIWKIDQIANEVKNLPNDASSKDDRHTRIIDILKSLYSDS